jgi:hypothetical protein
MSNQYTTNFIANINGVNQDLGNVFYNWSTNTVNIPVFGTTIKKNTINYKKPTIILETDITAAMDGYVLNGDQVYTFGPQVQDRIVYLGQGTNGAAYSNDGITINPLGTTNIQSNTAEYATWDGMKWTGCAQINAAQVTMVSYDGIYWVSTGATPFTGGWGWRVCYNGKIYLMAGGGATNKLAYSYDGLNWTGITAYACTSVYALDWNGLVWLVGSSGTNTLAYSYDGITWTGLGASSPLPTTLTYQVTWSGNKWILVGQNTSTSQISYTTNPTGASGWTSASTTMFSQYGFTSVWNGQIFLAGGGITSTTNTLAYSYDGINWTGLGLTTFSSQGGAGAGNFLWNGKMFILGGGTTNTLAYSYNGLNQIGLGTSVFSYPYSITQNIRRPHSITFQRRLTVAVGSGTGTKCAYSLDGINWVSYANTNVGSAGLAYNGKIWVTGSNIAGNSVAFSTDGYAWSHVPGTARVFETGSMQGLTWTGKIFVAASTVQTATTGNCLAYSYDGVTWLPASNTLTLFAATNSSAWCVASTPSLIIAGGNGTGTLINTLAYSTDGYNWTGLGNINGSTVCYGIATNGNMWVAVFNNGLAYSMDGFTWSATANNPFTSNVRGVAWNGALWVAVGSGTNSTAYSYDGINWTGGTNIFATSGYGVCWNGTVWVAGGTGTNNLAYSYDGRTWTGVTGTGTFSSSAYGVVSNYQIKPKPFIQHPTLAFGQGTRNTIAYSPDGINWTGLGSNIFTNQGRKAFWNGKIWVAGGSGGNTLAYSYDGIMWNGIGSTIITGQTNSVCYNGSIWVAAGYGGYALAYSYNGINWNGVTNSSQIFTSAGMTAVWNGRVWLATGYGGNTIAVSTNGITWTSVSNTNSSTNGYVYPATNGSLWVVPVNSSIGLMYSYDMLGQSGWSNVASSPFSSGCLCVTWNGSIWVAGGYGTNQIAYSTNGTTWSGISPAGMSGINVNDICWNGTRFVATTSSSIMAYSSNGINWYTTSNTNIFSTAGYGIASNSGVGAFVAPSAMVLNNYGISGNAMAASQTLEIVSSDPYYQTGFTNVTVKIETNNIY